MIALYILPLAGAPAATNPNEVVRIELATSIAFWARFDLEDSAAIYGLSEDVSIRDGKPLLRQGTRPLDDFGTGRVDRQPDFSTEPRHPTSRPIGRCAMPSPCSCSHCHRWFGSFWWGQRFPKSRPDAVAFALIAALTTPLWTYGTVFFGHASAALLITVAWFLLLGFPRPGSLPAGLAGPLFGGAIAGFAIATEYPTALLVAVIFATLLVRRTALSVLAGVAAGALAGVLPALVYHQIAFGAPWLTGYSFKAASDFQAIIAHGTFGVSWPSAEALWGIVSALGGESSTTVPSSCSRPSVCGGWWRRVVGAMRVPSWSPLDVCHLCVRFRRLASGLVRRRPPPRARRAARGSRRTLCGGKTVGAPLGRRD